MTWEMGRVPQSSALCARTPPLRARAGWRGPDGGVPPGRCTTPAVTPSAATGKLNVYEHDIRVPLLVRGPGINPGTVIPALSGNTDLAPTILDIAGGPSAINPIMDGKSLAGLLTGSSSTWARDTYLIE